jgi:hypothetical protein
MDSPESMHREVDFYDGPECQHDHGRQPSSDELDEAEPLDFLIVARLRKLIRERREALEELDRIRRVRCLGHLYSGLQPPEQCGDYAGHEGKCQP